MLVKRGLCSNITSLNQVMWCILVFFNVTSLALAWWRHQMKTLSGLLGLCEGNPPVADWFPPKRPVTRSLDVFFDLRLNKRLRKQSRRGDLRRDRAHYDVTVIGTFDIQYIPWIYTQLCFGVVTLFVLMVCPHCERINSSPTQSTHHALMMDFCPQIYFRVKLDGS